MLENQSSDPSDALDMHEGCELSDSGCGGTATVSHVSGHVGLHRACRPRAYPHNAPMSLHLLTVMCVAGRRMMLADQRDLTRLMDGFMRIAARTQPMKAVTSDALPASFTDRIRKVGDVNLQNSPTHCCRRLAAQWALLAAALHHPKLHPGLRIVPTSPARQGAT